MLGLSKTLKKLKQQGSDINMSRILLCGLIAIIRHSMNFVIFCLKVYTKILTMIRLHVRIVNNNINNHHL